MYLLYSSIIFDLAKDLYNFKNINSTSNGSVKLYFFKT